MNDLINLNTLIANEQKAESLEQIKQYYSLNSAENICRAICDVIRNHQSNLPDGQDIAIKASYGGIQSTILVESICCIGSTLIVFVGKDIDGNLVELIQHIHQLNFLLTFVNTNSQEPKRSIGFVTQQE